MESYEHTHSGTRSNSQYFSRPDPPSSGPLIFADNKTVLELVRHHTASCIWRDGVYTVLMKVINKLMIRFPPLELRVSISNVLLVFENIKSNKAWNLKHKWFLDSGRKSNFDERGCHLFCYWQLVLKSYIMPTHSLP